MHFSTPITEISGVGPQYQKKLEKLGIKTVGQLLLHFPHRYDDFSNLTPISEIKTNENVSIQGRIVEIDNSRTWKKRMVLTQALVSDDSGSIKVIWFNQPYLSNTLKKGDLIGLAGRIAFRENEMYLSSPAYEKISSFKSNNLTHTGRLVPVYPETEGLSSRWLRYIIMPLLLKMKGQLIDSLPEEVIKKNKLIPFERALWQAHFPDSLELAQRALKRFSFESLFLIELSVLKERQKLNKEKAKIVPINLNLIKKFVESLPFTLTGAQKKSSWQILKDLEKPRPMNRLLEGDVGSGKTVVAAIAALNTAKAGFQVAFMAPTEILAKQHFEEVKKLLKKFDLKIGLLTGKKKTETKDCNILIGTHALIQDKVKFQNLGLVIVDEQHRFGVDQRAKLCKQKSFIPHLLSMTATPIPRTLALTIYGDLDLSIIDELPKGRKKIVTKIVPPNKRERAYRFVREEVEKGRQVFVICPRIEPSDKDNDEETQIFWAEVKAVKEEYEKLSKSIFPDLKVAMLHGKMKSEEKEKTMRDFKRKKTDLLVSTSVVEVGVDVPNATIMMIEGAERFGLAQLYQFRGRVGRGEHQSYCLLFAESPARKTQRRLAALISAQNGFELAEKDLEIRGPGEIFGRRQWGIPDLAMDALKDILLVEKTRNTAKEILEDDPGLKKYPLLKTKLEDFRKTIHLE